MKTFRNFELIIIGTIIIIGIFVNNIPDYVLTRNNNHTKILIIICMTIINQLADQTIKYTT